MSVISIDLLSERIVSDNNNKGRQLLSSAECFRVCLFLFLRKNWVDLDRDARVGIV